MVVAGEIKELCIATVGLLVSESHDLGAVS